MEKIMITGGKLESVPEFCTCGARLPEDARFCHKCAKPQYDYPNIEQDSEPAVFEQAKPPAPKASAEISFRNSTAVGTGALAACLVFLLMFFFSEWLPTVVTVLWAGCLFGGGVIAVFFYVRLTGESISVRSGARMGWITGIFCFAIGFVMSTATMLYLSQSGGIAARWREELKLRGTSAPDIDKAMRLLENTPALVATVIFIVLFMFVLFTLLPTAGGAVGAKLMRRGSQP